MQRNCSLRPDVGTIVPSPAQRPASFPIGRTSAARALETPELDGKHRHGKKKRAGYANALPNHEDPLTAAFECPYPRPMERRICVETMN